MDVHHMFTISIAMIWFFCDAPLLDGCLQAFSTWKDGSFWVWNTWNWWILQCAKHLRLMIFWVNLILPCSNQSHGSGQSTISPAAFPLEVPSVLDFPAVFDDVWFAERHNWHKLVFHQWALCLHYMSIVSPYGPSVEDPPNTIVSGKFQPGDRIRSRCSWIIPSIHG